MKRYRVPFNKASLAGDEFRYIKKAITDGHISGGGYFTAECQKLLERRLSAKKVLLTTSCTHALEMAAMLLDIKKGDEVIVPSFTFVSTVNAFVLRGARPIFADIRRDTLNMDERCLERMVTGRTKAIVPVHYAGVGCEMDEIMRLAGARGISVVEDNAHGIFARYKGRMLGSFGDLSAISFHETKNFTCGEGGALICNNDRYISRAEILREKGTDRANFFRGEVDKYTWVDIGSSYVLSDILAAFLYAQLEASALIVKKRRSVWRRYYRALGSWAGGCGVALPFIPSHCEQSHHMFYLIMPDVEERESLIRHLKRKGIYSIFHYIPLHLSKMGAAFGGRAGSLPVTEDVAGRLLRLPLYNDLSEDEQGYVIRAILEWRPRRSVFSAAVSK